MARASTETAKVSALSANAAAIPDAATTAPPSGAPTTIAPRANVIRMPCSRARCSAATRYGGSAPTAGRNTASFTSTALTPSPVIATVCPRDRGPSAAAIHERHQSTPDFGQGRRLPFGPSRPGSRADHERIRIFCACGECRGDISGRKYGELRQRAAPTWPAPTSETTWKSTLHTCPEASDPAQSHRAR